MKNFFIGIIYTVVIAGILAHFSGCDVPDVSDITALLTPPAITASPTPTPSEKIPETEEDNDKNKVRVPDEKENETATPTAVVTLTPEEEGITPTNDYIWTTGSINVRKGPGVEYDKLGTVSKNTRLYRTGICSNGWLRVEYKDQKAFVSSKYCTTEDPQITKAPNATATPTPVIKNTPTPAGGESGSKVTVTPNPTPIIDDPKTVLSKIKKVNKSVDVRSASEFYYETEKEAMVGFLTRAVKYRSFNLLYKDESCIHTPEFLMSTYPEIYEVTIDYDKSNIYNNAIEIHYHISMMEGSQYIYAIRTGDTTFLTGEEKEALKALIKLSDMLELEGKSEIEIIKTAHDHLINNTRYDDPIGQDENGNILYSNESHTPYGLLLNQRAVCDGYADAFLILMRLNDIECITVTGNADGESHAWNQVKVDGSWYNVDVTWDDPISVDSSGKRVDVIRYNYFMINDEILWRTHAPKCGYSKLCVSDKYHMYIYEEFLCETEEDVLAQIERQIDNESLFFVYKKGVFEKKDLVDIFQSVHNVTFYSKSPVEITNGYYMYEIINPLK